MGKVIKVRRGVFETNSSSTHSITMCNESDYEKWVNGELYLARWGYKDKDFVTKKEYEFALEEFINECSDKDITEDKEELENEFIGDYGFLSFKDWCDNFDYETEVSHFTTPSGDKVVALCYYGNDY